MSVYVYIYTYDMLLQFYYNRACVIFYPRRQSRKPDSRARGVLQASAAWASAACGVACVFPTFRCDRLPKAIGFFTRASWVLPHLVRFFIDLDARDEAQDRQESKCVFLILRLL